MASWIDCTCDSASCRDCRQEAKSHGQSAGSFLPSTTVSAGSKRSQTVSAGAKYDGQSLQEEKISRRAYTMRQCSETHTINVPVPYPKTKEKKALAQIDKRSRKTRTVNRIISSFLDRWSCSYLNCKQQQLYFT